MRNRQSGFSVVEVLLAVAFMALVVTALVGAVIYGRESMALAGNRNRALFLAEEGLEAARNLRGEAWANLAVGTWGLVTTGNQWGLGGASDTTGIFLRTITISTVDAERKQVISTVTWPQNAQRNGEVVLITYLTTWPVAGTPPDSCSVYCQSLGGYTTGTCRAGPAVCTANGEVYESGGDVYCTGGPSADTCCCQI